jgi:hypothetical protein
MEYTEEFLEFWRLYPPRFHESWRPRAGGGAEHYWKDNKRRAMEQWHKLTVHQKKWAMYSVKFMTKGKYVPDAFRWLRDGKYEDIDMPKEVLPVPDIVKTIKFEKVPSIEVNVNNRRNEELDKLERKLK